MIAPIGPAEFERLQRETFEYFVKEANPRNGLIADKTQPGAPASIAAVGLALSLYPIGVARKFMDRADAVQRTLTTLRFFSNSVQGIEADATGYKGFYYHFLDMRSGRRVWECELSTVDTAFLLAGDVDRGGVFPRRHGRRARDPRARRQALPAHRLAMGAKRRTDGLPRLEAREPFPALSLARL